MTGRPCPECGGSLIEDDHGAGSLWRCEAHGVKAWLLESEEAELLLHADTTARF